MSFNNAFIWPKDFRFLRGLAVAALLLGTQFGVRAKEIQVFYTENPPLICSKNGEIDCIAGNLVKSAAKAGGFTLKVDSMPWARALESLETTPNAIFLANGRNEYSEKGHGWYFLVYTDDVFVFTLGDRKIKTDADIGKLGRVGIRRGSPFGAYLDARNYGDKKFETNDWVQATQMLNGERLDAMLLTGLIGRTNIIDIGKIPAASVNTYKVGEMGWWINAKAGPLSPELVEFKKLLDAERAKPGFADVLKKYGVR